MGYGTHVRCMGPPRGTGPGPHSHRWDTTSHRWDTTSHPGDTTSHPGDTSRIVNFPKMGGKGVLGSRTVSAGSAGFARTGLKAGF